MAIAGNRAVLLDITRSLLRRDRGAPTGIDRVEAAYIEAIEARYLYHSAHIWAVLDADGYKALCHGNAGLDLRARLTPWRDQSRRALETALRRHAVWHGTGPVGLSKVMGQAWHFLTVGHAGPELSALNTMRSQGMTRFTAMVHDTIPLDHPEWCRPEATARFERRLRAVGAVADQVIYVSPSSQMQAEEWFVKWGRVPIGTVIPPGIDVPNVSRTPERGRFLILGTVEPRKNHDLLIDVWPELASKQAVLHVVGHTGWGGQPILDRLSQTQGVIVHGPLPDADVADHLARADALLFPSLAEGAGLPVGEALGIELPVFAHELPCLQDLFGSGPNYLSGRNPADWQEALGSYVTRSDVEGASYLNERLEKPLPTWQTHFNVLERLLE